MSSDASDAPMQVIKLRHLWTWAASVLVVGAISLVLRMVLKP